MARAIYHWDRKLQKMVEGPAPRDSSNPAHLVIGDEMKDTVHPCDGRVYNSKSEFRKTTRAHGCIEIGNEPLKDTRDLRPKGTKEALIKAWEKLNGN